MVGAVRQGVAVLAAMIIIFGAWVGFAVAAEHQANPAVQAAGLIHQPTGNTTGKEVRFGVPSSALFGVASTQTSTGSADSAYDSFTPIGGGALLTGMMLGEVTPGGVGSGMYTILIYAIIAVFIGGLMVGRTPEYLGKKIQATEVKLAGLGTLVMPITVLVVTGLAVSLHAGQIAPENAGPHGFSEILYALTSQGNNNGSAFGGLTGNTPFYNILGGIDMLIGRFGIMIPAIALGGVLAAKNVVSGRRRHVPLRHPHVRRPADRRHHHRRRPDLLPRRVPRSDRRAVQSRKVLLNDRHRHRRPASSARPRRTAWRSPAASSTRRSSKEALVGSFTKLDPRVQVKNPVMFVVLIGSVITFIESIAHGGIFNWSITIWLFLTVLFANFAEAMAEGRGKAQALALRKMRSETMARRLLPDGTEELVPAAVAGQGRPRGVRGRRPHPLRRGDHRGRGLGRRVGHHR